MNQSRLYNFVDYHGKEALACLLSKDWPGVYDHARFAWSLASQLSDGFIEQNRIRYERDYADVASLYCHHGRVVFAHESHMHCGVSEIERLRGLINQTIEAWGKSQDCSRHPGHYEMHLAIGRLMSLT